MRERIVAAGLETLLEKGFNGCGVKDITDLAGVPKGSFYNHFESKEALGAEIVERYGQANDRRLALRDAALPPMERLRRHFEGLSQVLSAQGRGCLLGNFSAEMADHSKLIREKLAVLFAAWTADIEKAIREAQKTGAIATRAKPDDLAAFILDAFEGALLRARVEKSARAFERFMSLVFTQLLV
jgi:TetR/AcrR family transcriptional regulator, transcriptional repressor for nem operon